MQRAFYILLIAIIVTTNIYASEASLSDLKNYQVNSANMVSSGEPTKQHFESLKAMGVAHVIDLIPGDRSDQVQLMKVLNLNYYNIPVEWKNPTVDNFNDYALMMKKFSLNDGKILTHCRLNWRGAVFTYLYRVIHLNEKEEIAKADLLAIWEPNDVWQAFIDKVKAQPDPVK